MTHLAALRPFFCGLLTALTLLTATTAQAQICSREYAPVCGHIVDQAPQTFPNRCTLDNAQARFITQGECPHTPLSSPVPQPQPMPGSDSDAHACKGSAGFVWNAEMACCIRPWMSSAVTLEVAAYRQKCTGLIEMQCLMVRELKDGQKKPRWTPLFGDIQGYKHPTGQRQLLRVRKDRQENVPADAPSTTYTLIKKIR